MPGPMKMPLSLGIAVLFATGVTAAVPSLTPDNFDEMTYNKTVFIKFFAPWCGHCKSMAGDWERLFEEYQKSTTALVAEVDCTAEGERLCQSNGVKGYPTLKYGNPSSLDDYKGSKVYEDLSKFAAENLGPKCSPTNIDLCSDDMKAQIEEFMTKTVEELDAAIEEQVKKLNEIEEDFKKDMFKKIGAAFESMKAEEEERLDEMKPNVLDPGLMEHISKLQVVHDKMNAEKEKQIAAIKATGIDIMKAVKFAKTKAAKGSDEL